MNLFMHVIFSFSLAWLGYIYLGYPGLLWLLGFVRPYRAKSREDFSPSVSVLVSARNEERDIGWKVMETLNWDYPPGRLDVLVASDASEDRTDEIVQTICDPRLRFVRMPKRVGKNVALNRLYELSHGDLVFFTDANSHIDAGSLRRIVSHFADPSVGCVTGGERTIREEKGSLVAAGSWAYLGYESLINCLESRLGSVLVCDGSIFCIRRHLYAKLQPDLANDLELPVQIGYQGYALLYEPTARSVEKSTPSFREEFDRRRRICGQGILGCWRLRKSVRGLRAWQFVSRKFLRWLGLIPLGLLLVSSAWLSALRFFGFMLAFQLLFYACALVGWGYATRGRNIGSLAAFPFYFVVVNLAALTGVIETCLGRRFSVWEVASLSRGRESTTVDVGRP